ncbi:hypothetical protein [Brevundimonas diminuta]|uniref:hypothetical protein n=1 Tax=Brevundimonas diminuta TaxID=293 RepID=UPI0030F4E028
MPGPGQGTAEDRLAVERALHLFLDVLPRRLRFADAAGMLGIRPEVLRRAYERCRINPRGQVRAARLERLDRDLRAGRHATLSEALIRWGFPLAAPSVLADYHARYGRHPQETLDAALALRRSGARSQSA